MLGTADDGARGRQRWRRQGMMADENAEGFAGKLSEEVADGVHLMVRDAAIAEGNGACRVDAEDGKLGIGDEGTLGWRDVMAETSERLKEPPRPIGERNDLIAWYFEYRCVDPIEGIARRRGLVS